MLKPYWKEVPDEVRMLPREQRIKWYSRRAARWAPVFRVLESIDSGLLADEIRRRLRDVRADIRDVEGAIELAQSEEFQALRADLTVCVRTARTRTVQQGRLEMRSLRGDVIDAEGRIAELRREVEAATDGARGIERRMREMCGCLGCDAEQYMRLGRFVGRSGGHSVECSVDRSG